MPGAAARDGGKERLTRVGGMRNADVQTRLVERTSAHFTGQRGVCDQPGQPRSREEAMRVRAPRCNARMQRFDAKLLTVAARLVDRRPGPRAELFEHDVLPDRVTGRQLVIARRLLTNALERARQAVAIECDRIEQCIDGFTLYGLLRERSRERSAGGDPADIFRLEAESVAAQSGKVRQLEQSFELGSQRLDQHLRFSVSTGTSALILLDRSSAGSDHEWPSCPKPHREDPAGARRRARA